MGGINHQPCKKYLVESTRLSRSISRARAHFELANVAFENALLSEMDDKVEVVSALNRCISLLNICVVDLEEAGSNLAKLLKKMDERDFQDLSSLQETDIESLGQTLFKGERLATLTTWRRASSIIRKGGYRAMMKVIDGEINALLSEIKNLSDAFGELRTKFPSIGIGTVLEQNLPGNIRLQFAAVYSHWTEFSSLFLCSSLISTELSYKEQGYRTLSESI